MIVVVVGRRVPEMKEGKWQVLLRFLKQIAPLEGFFKLCRSNARPFSPPRSSLGVWARELAVINLF